MIIITGTAQDWRIDNNIFNDGGVPSASTIRIGANDPYVDSFTYGLIDHNQFLNRNDATSIFVEWPRGILLDPTAAGDWIWGQPAERGTAQAVYIEDNIFSGTGDPSQVIDSRWGAKYVLRHNTIHNPWISTHSGCTNFGRNPVSVEIYKNSMTSDDDARFRAIEMRSVSGIIWGNTIGPDHSVPIGLDHERSWTDCMGAYGAPCDGNRSFDENTPGVKGWRCLGQPGWGQPQAMDMSAYTFAGFFAWQNIQRGADVDVSLFGDPGDQDIHLVGGRDFFSTGHITVGPIGSRPSTCSPEPSERGVYVSTDENSQGATLYVCTATNVWTKHWEPFTYPHPLVVPGTTPSPSRESGSSSGCFIATAAFGSPLAQEVRVLREFRDRALLPHAPGQLFAAAYYRLSPPLAAWIRQHEVLRTATRAFLWPVVWWAHLALVSPALALALGGGGLGAGALLLARLHRAGRAPLPPDGARVPDHLGGWRRGLEQARVHRDRPQARRRGRAPGGGHDPQRQRAARGRLCQPLRALPGGPPGPGPAHGPGGAGPGGDPAHEDVPDAVSGAARRDASQWERLRTGRSGGRGA
jgi:hypothetical protein